MSAHDSLQNPEKPLVLVIGGGGFVGQALVADGQSVRITDRAHPTSVPEGVDVHVGDIGDPEFCRAVLEHVSVVYYLAGYKRNIKAHQEHPFDFVVGNCQPFLTFLDIFRQTSTARLIYMSTTHVLQSRESTTDGYVIGKSINERVLEVLQSEQGMSVSIARFPGIYGPGDHFGPDANLIPALIERVAKSTTTLEVWGTGNRETQLMYIDDVVHNLHALMHEGPHVATIGNPEVAKVRDIVEYIERAFGTEHQITYNAHMPDAPTHLYTFENVVVPHVSLQEGIQRTVAYYKSLDAHHV